MTKSNDIVENLLKLLKEISIREKKKAIEAGDYGSAFVLAILEGSI